MLVAKDAQVPFADAGRLCLLSVVVCAAKRPAALYLLSVVVCATKQPAVLCVLFLLSVAFYRRRLFLREPSQCLTSQLAAFIRRLFGRSLVILRTCNTNTHSHLASLFKIAVYIVYSLHLATACHQ